MKALLVVAHGSRVADSNLEIEALAAKLREDHSGYTMIGHAFLEMASPSIMQGATHLIDQGATTITVLPYFLVAGSHVLRDIPGGIDELREQYPSVQFHITDYFGASENISALVLQHIRPGN